MTPILDIRLKRPSKIYREGESVSGVIIISCPTETRHEGVSLTVDGVVNLELSSKSVGQYESFYNSVKVTIVLFFKYFNSAFDNLLNSSPCNSF